MARYIRVLIKAFDSVFKKAQSSSIVFTLGVSIFSKAGVPLAASFAASIEVCAVKSLLQAAFSTLAA